MRYGSVGVGSFPQFDMEILSRRAGIALSHIPNRNGASGMLNDLVRGDTQVSFLNVATSGPMVQAGQPIPSSGGTATASALGTDIGDVGRNCLRGARQVNFDFSLAKLFPWTT